MPLRQISLDKRLQGSVLFLGAETMRTGKVGAGKARRKCSLCDRQRSRFVQHHISYDPPQTIDICGLCHWIIHRPQHQLGTIASVLSRYVELYGQIPLAPHRQHDEILGQIRGHLAELQAVL